MTMFSDFWLIEQFTLEYNMFLAFRLSVFLSVRTSSFMILHHGLPIPFTCGLHSWRICQEGEPYVNIQRWQIMMTRIDPANDSVNFVVWRSLWAYHFPLVRHDCSSLNKCFRNLLFGWTRLNLLLNLLLNQTFFKLQLVDVHSRRKRKDSNRDIHRQHCWNFSTSVHWIINFPMILVSILFLSSARPTGNTKHFSTVRFQIDFSDNFASAHNFFTVCYYL